MAGVARFELTNKGVKVLCLTAWRYPYADYGIIPQKPVIVNSKVKVFKRLLYLTKQYFSIIILKYITILEENAMTELNNDDIVRMKIANALVNLMLDRDYKSVSITEIAKEAGISRATFYRHFSSKVDVLYYCFDNIVLRFYRSVSMDFDTVDGYREAVRHTFRTIRTYKRILRATIEADCTDFIRNYIDGQYARAYQKDGKVSITAYIYSGAFSNVIIKWLEENCETPIDELTESVVQVTHPNLHIKQS